MVVLCRFIMLFLLTLCSACWGEQRFPPPDFESGHELPEMTAPAARASWMAYRDVAALTVALGVGCWLSLKQRSRRWIFALALLSLIYFGFYRKGCVCAIGALQNVTLATFDGSYGLPLAVLAFFVLPLLFTLFFGRGFCGSVCPLGAIQEAVLLRPVQVPYWVEQSLSLLAYLYLAAAVLFSATGAAFLICRYDPFVAFFRLDGPLDIVILGASLLLIGVFVGRPYCRFLCPYGVLLRLMSRFSRWRVTITPTDCTRCHLCAESCPYGALQKPQSAPATDRLGSDKIRLAFLILLCPLLTAGGAVVGYGLSDAFARMHPTVRQADLVAIEEDRPLVQASEPVIAYRTTGRPAGELMQQATLIQTRFRRGTWLLGAFMGLVAGIKLIRANIYRTRSDYLADPGRCLACGRCFAYCPVEQERLLQIRSVS